MVADSGFHSKDNVDITNQKSINAYIPDVGFRKRDPRFANAQAHRKPVNRSKKLPKHKWYRPRDFTYDAQKDKLICPAGKELYIKNSNYEYKGSKAIAYMARKSDCEVCHLRHLCIRNPNTPARQVHIFYDHESAKDQALEAMKRKIDSPVGRYIYSLRMKIVEPVFANIRACIGLDRFSLRGAKKVDIQWQLFAIIHNIGKITRFGYGFT